MSNLPNGCTDHDADHCHGSVHAPFHQCERWELIGFGDKLHRCPNPVDTRTDYQRLCTAHELADLRSHVDLAERAGDFADADVFKEEIATLTGAVEMRKAA